MVQGWPVAHAAEAAEVSRQTAYRWLNRFREEGEAGLQDRSRRPHRDSNRVSSETEERIVSDRIREKEGPHLVAARLGVPRSTIYRVLCRRGLSRLSDLDRTTGSRSAMSGTVQANWCMWTSKGGEKVPDGGGWKVL